MLSIAKEKLDMNNTIKSKKKQSISEKKTLPLSKKLEVEAFE
jgi:hypothetical protein